MRRHLLKTAAVFAIAASMYGAPAIAQESDDENSRRLGAVTVTAQRVEENLQDVPIAVTALSTEQLEDKQVQDVLDLQFQVPNINLATNTGTASAARIFLRGVGEDESRGAVDQAVGIYVDGVYIGRSVGSLFDVVDLESIEVLRGPQGTLYGRNTIGGAIKLQSVAPQFENSGDVRTTVGNNGRFDLRGTVNRQIGDNMAFRLTALHRERDGFHDLNPTGAFADQGREVGRQHIFSYRASLLQEYNNDWSWQLTYDNTMDRSDPIPDSAAPGNDADNDIFTIEPLPGAPACSAFTPANFQPLGCFTNYNSDVSTSGWSFNLSGPLWGHDFTSITGYRELEDELTTRIGFPYTQATDQDQFSQEFTMASNNEGPFNYVAGVYYWQEDLQLDTTFVFPFSVNSTTDSIALFGQGTYEITDQFSLTGGLRFTDESKDFNGEGPFGFGRVDSADFENVSVNITADYAFTDDVLGYAKYATGFKSGGWSPDAFSGTAVFLPVEEETLDSFEAGVKTTSLDGNLRFNATAFFNQYEGLQIGATVPGFGFTRFNVDESEISGLEFDGVFQVSDNLQFNGNLGILNAEYTDVTGDQARGLSNNGAGCATAVDPTIDSQIIPCALGLELKNAPEYKGSIGVLFTQQLASGEMILSGDIGFEDDSWSLVANSPDHALIDVPTLVNLRAKYQADAGWSAAVWAKNATDEEYYRASSANSFTTYASDPLTYGIDLGYTF